MDYVKKYADENTDDGRGDPVSLVAAEVYQQWWQCW